MKFAFCLFIYFPYGGLQRDFLNIAQMCLQRGHEVDVYTLEWQGERPKDLNIHIVPQRGLTSHGQCVYFSEYLQQLFLTKTYDAIVGFNKMAGLDVYFAADVCFKEKLKHSWRRHFARYRNFCRLEEQVFAPHCTTDILYISETQKIGYQQNYNTPDDRFHFVMPSINPIYFKIQDKSYARQAICESLSLNPDCILLLAVGSGFKAKGLDRSLRAIAALPAAQRDKVCFLIAGQNSARYFTNLTKRLNLSTQVKFLGGRDDIPQLLLAADFLLHPAYLESGGIVLLEALLSGLPVLASEGSGFAYHVADAKAGIVVAADATQALINHALLNLLTASATQRQAWQENARSYARQADFTSATEKALSVIEAAAQRSNKLPIITQRRWWDNYDIAMRADFYQAFHQPDVFTAINTIQGKTYRAIVRRETLEFMYNDQSFFIKRHRGVGWHEIFKNLLFLRYPVLSAATEFNSVRRLEKLGIDTLSVVAYGKRGWNPAQQQSFLITKALQHTISLEDFCRDWPQQPPAVSLKWALLKKIADIARTLHLAGLNHRDFYICHFLLKQLPGLSLDINHLSLYLIDLHRMQQHKQLPQRWQVKDLGGLYFSAMNIGLTQRDLLRFIKTYTQQDLRQQLQDVLWLKVKQRALALSCQGIC